MEAARVEMVKSSSAQVLQRLRNGAFLQERLNETSVRVSALKQNTSDYFPVTAQHMGHLFFTELAFRLFF